jgi:hypothetical protein
MTQVGHAATIGERMYKTFGLETSTGRNYLGNLSVNRYKILK